MKKKFNKPAKPSTKPVIPGKMKGKVFNSLFDLGSALGFKPEEPDTPKSKKCRKCGTVMNNVPGTNVWLCPGTNEDGNPCNTRLILASRPTV